MSFQVHHQQFHIYAVNSMPPSGYMEIWQMEAENRAKILLFRSRPPQRITQGKITAAPEAVGAAACVRVWGLGRQQNIQASSTSHCFDCGGWSYRWGGSAAEGRVTDGVSDLSDVIRWENQPWMWNRVDRHLSGWQQSVQLITSFRFQQNPFSLNVGDVADKME